MSPHLPRFLDLEAGPANPLVAILPFGYEGTVTYGSGTAQGPASILAASQHVELYDEQLRCEPSQVGIITLPQPALPQAPEAAVNAVRDAVAAILADQRFPVVLGGEHTISVGVYQALAAAHPGIGVIQIDAHADLRESYEGRACNHACVMARIHDLGAPALQLGIRSLSTEEAGRIREERLSVGFMHDMRAGVYNVEAALARLPQQVFLTLDVDALDLSLVRATGTPEPGGLDWEEIHELLERIFQRKTVVGFDIVELCGGDAPSAFTVARLIYRMIGWRFCPRAHGKV